jgi:hypothetical protein
MAIASSEKVEKENHPWDRNTIGRSYPSGVRISADLPAG